MPSTLSHAHLTLTRAPRPPAGAPRDEVVAQLRETARQIRLQDLALVHFAGAGHIGGDFSAVDVLTVLYGAVLDVAPDRVDDPERDRFVLSKGHVAGSYYVTLAAYGFLPVEQLATFLKPLSTLGGHPNRLHVPGVEASTGPLGHGLPIAVGQALAARLDSSPRQTYVLTGDGEMQEGSNWEAMMSASHYGLDNLTVVVDRNGLQQGASTEASMDLAPLADKARAFGFAVSEVDGHDHGALLDLLGSRERPGGRPRFVIAHTHKGHPISFMSDQVAWHHKVPDADQYATARAELDALAPAAGGAL
ncbi:transketolase [Auraticoccus sp. F435]|uniref:Transketolase n=1 Tax=Auraticoccus cholistanensis TaxID=2656650 RepID=A0A6A9V025_9ACTN|nr:transketolase [Auraticoccus cholistanensis]MVA74680.1 transketolase [Auraticoccus cholistanensis]